MEATTRRFACTQCGALVDPAMTEARAQALVQAGRDAPWKAALVKAMKRSDRALPAFAQIEQAAPGNTLAAAQAIAGQRRALA